LKKLFGFIKISDVIEGHIRVLQEDVGFDHVDQVSVGTNTVWVDGLCVGFRFLLLFLGSEPGLIVVALPAILLLV